VSRQKAVGDIDLAQLCQIFQSRHSDLFAGAFEDAGAAAKTVFLVIGDGMIDQDLPGLFDVEQWLVGNEA
jgi:hypothetical protein